MLAGGQPVLLGVGIDLEDVGPRAVDGLLPKGDEEEVVNLLVPQYQRLAKPSAETPVAQGGVRSPWQPDYHLAIFHSYTTEREAAKGLLHILIVTIKLQQSAHIHLSLHFLIHYLSTCKPKH